MNYIDVAARLVMASRIHMCEKRKTSTLNLTLALIRFKNNLKEYFTCSKKLDNLRVSARLSRPNRIMTSSRNLILHTVQLLKQYETVRLGAATNEDRKLSKPIAVEEDEMLETYLAKEKVRTDIDLTCKITGKNECGFMRETFLGCVRRGPFLEVMKRSNNQATLQRFLANVGGPYLQKEYYLFAVICYLALWRLEEIGFDAFSRFVQCFDPNKMAAIVGFLFNADRVQNELHSLWCTLLDEHFVRDRIIEPIVHHVSNALQLVQDLKRQAAKGMEIQKVKKVTEPSPFLLTIPNVRKFIQPTVAIATVIKAREIPKGLFKQPKDKIALDKAKLINKEKSTKLLKSAQTNVFGVAKQPTVDRKAIVRERVLQEELERQEKNKVKPYRPLDSNMNAIISVKLTTAAILREDALLRKKKKDQMDMIEQAEKGLRDVEEFEAWKDGLKIKEDEERMLDLEKKRLEVQLLHEETFLARQELIKDNK